MSGCSGSTEGSVLARSEDLSETKRIGVQAAAMQAVDIPFSLAPFASSVSSLSVVAAVVLPAFAAGLGSSCVCCW